MKQLLILSGKGGTGKTTIASAFIRLSCARAYADCDVDAPNLHLVTSQTSDPRKSDYFGLPKAEINRDLCDRCGQCRMNCRFEAISADQGYRVDPYACEGCGVCEAVCPTGAISLKPFVAGECLLYLDNEKVFSTARLKMGSGTSGKLVAEVKKNLREAAAPHTELAIIDGSPGIGCSVIASMSGVDMVLIVVEPSVSGISDMERVLKTAETFRTSAAVCINKYDTNLHQSERIESYCRERELPFMGKVPFDPCAVKAINRGKTIMDIDCPAAKAVREIFGSTLRQLLEEDKIQT